MTDLNREPASSAICVAACLYLFVGSSFADYRSRIDSSAAKPIGELPGQIRAPAGQITLFADYENAEEGGITLYLVNRTGKPVTIPTQDGNPYIKLEAQVAGGAWKRAQGHVYSWCGNSYFSPPVLPSNFFCTMTGSYPTKGEPRRVRYKIYSSLGFVSNEGRGAVDPSSIDACKYDLMAINFGDLALLKEILLEAVALPGPSWQSPRAAAVRRLREFDFEDIEPTLRKLFGRTDTDERLFEEILRSYKEKGPAELRGLIVPAIEDDISARREWILKHIGKFEDDAFIRALAVESKDPGDPHLRLILNNLGLYERLGAREELERIMDAPEYGESDRLQCEYLRERRFGESASVGLKTKLYGSYSEGYQAPIPFSVLLTNHRKEPLRLRFDSIAEILGFWVSGGQERDFVKPKAGVSWFTPRNASTQATTVVIGSGETRELTINLLDYFDFSETRESNVVVTVRCKIPGIHELPFLSTTGHGVPIKESRLARDSGAGR